MKVYEILYESTEGIDNQVVTAEDEESAVERFDGVPVKVICRGPYLGDGPFQELRAEIKNRELATA